MNGTSSPQEIENTRMGSDPIEQRYRVIGRRRVRIKPYIVELRGRLVGGIKERERE